MPTSAEEWDAREARCLSSEVCAKCKGSGMRIRGVCGCVLKRIFRICFRQFAVCVEARNECWSPASYNGRGAWDRKNEEFIADFLLVAKRTLTVEEHRIFRFHFLLGGDWNLCCRKLKLDKGNYFHAIYRIEMKLGRAFRTLKPYGLFPPATYFTRAA